MGLMSHNGDKESLVNSPTPLLKYELTIGYSLFTIMGHIPTFKVCAGGVYVQNRWIYPSQY